MKTKQYAKVSAEIELLEAEHELQLKKLKARKEVLRVSILTAMEENKEKSVTDDFGKFTRTVRTYYSYSDKTNNLNERWKTAKVKEEQSGSAKVKSESVSLRYTPCV